MDFSKTRVIVIGRNYTSRLGMIRALGRAGHNVYVIQTNGTQDIDSQSRFIKGYYRAEEPNRDLLISTIINIQEEFNEKTILIPVDDYAASVIDENVEVLKDKFYFPNINMESGAIKRLMDKELQKDLAIKAGFNVAKGCVIIIKEGNYTIPENIEYPCFPKPQISITGNKTCMKCCKNKEELKDTIDLLIKRFPNCSLLVEQFIQIEHEYATLGFSNGKEVILPGMIEMLESSRAHKGVTMRGKIMPPENYSVFLEKVKEFILKNNFVGLFDIDSYESHGIIYFNELNCRFGASGYSVTNSGINLPSMLVNYFLGLPINFQQKLSRTLFFVNEKYVRDDVAKGFISYFDMDKYIYSADFGFIKDDGDMEPYKLFCKKNSVSIKSHIKYLLRCLKFK